MGGSSSKTTLKKELDMLTVNRSTLNLMSKQLNDMVITATINNASSCTSEIINSQEIEIVDVYVEGTANMDIVQEMRASLSFDCVNVTHVRNEVVKSMISSIIGNLERTTSTDILAELETKAQTKAESQFNPLDFGGTSSETNTDELIKIRTINENMTNIQDIVENVIHSTFTSNTVNKCVTTVRGNQSFKLRNTNAGTFNFTIKQDIAKDLLSKCVNDTNIGNTINTAMTKVMDIAIKEDVSTTSDVKSTTDVETTALSKGIFEGVGTMVENIGNAISNVMGGIIGPYAAVCGLVVICLAIICIVSAVVISQMDPETIQSLADTGADLARDMKE